jgi:hypothetical protein
MITDKNKLLKLLGLRPTGDLGPYTIYTSKRRATVAFPRSPPTKPASLRQRRQRDKWTAAAQAWAELPSTIREHWLNAAKRAALKITGHNLWIWYALAGDDETIRTIEYTAQIALVSPTPPPR